MKAEQLILLERVEIDEESTFDDLEKDNVVDSSFKHFVEAAGFKISYLNVAQYS